MEEVATPSDPGGRESEEADGGSLRFSDFGDADLEVFGTLLEEHRPDVVRYAFSVFGDWDCAEDVTHRAFVALLERGRNLDSPAAVRASLFQAVRNRSLKVARRRRTRRRLERPARESLYDAPNSPEEALADQEWSDRLRAALEALAPRRREALIMARLQGLSHREIAKEMNLSPQTVANHVSLALQDLRELLGTLEEDQSRRS